MSQNKAYSDQSELENARKRTFDETVEKICEKIWECAVSKVMDSMIEFDFNVVESSDYVKLQMVCNHSEQNLFSVIFGRILKFFLIRRRRKNSKEMTKNKEEIMSEVTKLFNKFEGNLLEQARLLDKVCQRLREEKKVYAKCTGSYLLIYT